MNRPKKKSNRQNVQQYDYNAVYSILVNENPHIDFTGRKVQIKLLCAMACVATAPSDYVAKYEDDSFEFKNGILNMPVDCVRVVRLRTNEGKRIRYRLISNTSAQILDYTNGEVLVDWWGVPEDENGLPPISLKQLPYCVAKCKLVILREYWETGKITENIYAEAKRDEYAAHNQAVKKNMTADEMEASLWMMRNGMYYKNADILKARTAGNRMG